MANRGGFIAGLVGLALFMAAWPAVAEDSVTGWWLDESGRAAILVAPCGEMMCGKIGWLKEPLDPETGQPRLDRHNDDPAMRDRPVCGLPLLWGFIRDGDSAAAWQDGRIYDPESGNTYHANLTLQPDGTLKLRGYIGISLIGRSQIWSRPSAPVASCLS